MPLLRGLTLQSTQLSDDGVVAICTAGHYKLDNVDIANNGLGCTAASCIAIAMGRNLMRATLAQNRLTSAFVCKGEVEGDTSTAGAKVCPNPRQTPPLPPASPHTSRPRWRALSAVWRTPLESCQGMPAPPPFDVPGIALCVCVASRRSGAAAPLLIPDYFWQVLHEGRAYTVIESETPSRWPMLGDFTGLVAIAEALKTSPSLTVLDLSSNALCGVDGWTEGTYTTEGIAALAEGLKHTRSLMRFDLSLNPLGAEGARALAGMASAAARPLLRCT